MNYKFQLQESKAPDVHSGATPRGRLSAADESRGPAIIKENMLQFGILGPIGCAMHHEQETDSRIWSPASCNFRAAQT